MSLVEIPVTELGFTRYLPLVRICRHTVRERIAREIYDRLELLTTGYSCVSVSEVIRPTRMGGFTPKHLQIVLTLSDGETVPELMCPGNPPATCYRQQYNVRCHVMPSEQDDAIADAIVSTMAADVVSVISDESLFSLWYQMDGLAINSEIGPIENIIPDGSYIGANVPVIVTYRTDENNPYNSRA